MRKSLNGLKISLNQMPVVPGRPDLNAKYIIDSIKEASEDKVDILIFPEMCVPGYVIGDLFEDECFVKEIELLNRQIIKASPIDMTVIFGTLVCDQSQRNEDGRYRKYNAAIVASAGCQLSVVMKTLQPNYRIFDDDRHFFGTRKYAYDNGEQVEDYLVSVEIKTRIGLIAIGVILCEDMWHKDYPINPTQILVDKGAELVINLSASPWTWQKNRKRHQVVKDLLKISPVPFVYVNNTGTQNNGKNIIVFDGSSTVYHPDGEIIMAVAPYATGNHNFSFSKKSYEIIRSDEKKFMNREEQIQHDAAELYAGWECAVRGAFANLPKPMRKAVIGLSGGIDSAVDTALLTHILGPENVYCINMPSQYNGQQTKNIAKQIADNLGVHYEIRPINAIVDAICAATGTEVDTLSYENVQARVRMEILAARCQDLGAVFICNSNKIEAAFGYGTMYGDIAGFLAPLGDMLKYEVYQMGDYMNRVIYQQEVIPAECFTIPPTAELKDKQRDPFHYGNLKRRGYHDELVRAFVEFRYNPELILEKYIDKDLEKEFRLEPGTLYQLFKKPAEFIVDLEKNYNLFMNSFFKRHPAPTVPILSRRAFGFDLRESQLSPFFTSRYYELKQLALSKEVSRSYYFQAINRIAVFGGSFNPPCLHHQGISRQLSREFDHLIIVPCGKRADKDLVGNDDRGIMVNIAFCGCPNAEIDFNDLHNGVYTPTYLLEERYAAKYPGVEIWHVVGSDLVAGGRDKNSQIQTTWKNGPEIWQTLKFCVIIRPGYELSPDDLPPVSKVLETEKIFGSGTEVRALLADHKDTSEFLDEAVLTYIKAHKLYGY
ncbi:MAG: NAD(+) synthase [Patescibacteria group bacterium]